MKRTPLERRTPLKRMTKREHMATPLKPKRSGFTPASKEQKLKVEGACCAACGADWIDVVLDPAHVCARAQGGCDDALCVLPLCRPCHRAFDDGRLDLQPHIVGWYGPEIGHAAEHYNGDLIALLQRLTGTRWGPLEGGEGL